MFDTVAIYRRLDTLHRQARSNGLSPESSRMFARDYLASNMELILQHWEDRKKDEEEIDHELGLV